MGNIVEADQKIIETSQMKCSTYDYDEFWVFNMIMMDSGYIGL